jgi:hypothetical protein
VDTQPGATAVSLLEALAELADYVSGPRIVVREPASELAHEVGVAQVAGKRHG